MVVRGAPLIGITAAFGIYLASRENDHKCYADFEEALESYARKLLKTRPTAVNLAWAVERQLAVVRDNAFKSPPQITQLLLREAKRILREDIEVGEKIGKLGAVLLPRHAMVLTYCNTGALATGGAGTALSIIRHAYARGRVGLVWVCETRPRFQGASLTAFELEQLGIPYRIITDDAAGHLMATGKVDVVVVGADRIAQNGDVANKIGTYTLAVLARHHGIPFYVAAPSSTLDPALQSGQQIPIEERSEAEIVRIGRHRLAPEGAPAYNPAFDITPFELISGILTENGLWQREPVATSQLVGR